LKESPQITIYGDGEQTRDFVFVKDLVKIILESLRNDRCAGELFNICTGHEVTLNEIVKMFERITGKKPTVSYFDRRQGDIRESVGASEKGKGYIDLEQFTPVEEGLRLLMGSL